MPEVTPFMPFLKGLIAERGGSLSIASGCAREYGIPTVVGVNGLMGTIHNGDVIPGRWIKGNRGYNEVVDCHGQTRGSITYTLCVMKDVLIHASNVRVFVGIVNFLMAGRIAWRWTNFYNADTFTTIPCGMVHP